MIRSFCWTDKCDSFRYIAEGAPPGNYEQDAGFEGGTAGGCLYNVSQLVPVTSNSLINDPLTNPIRVFDLLSIGRRYPPARP